LLGKIVAILPEVDNLANRRVCVGRDFYQVQPECLRATQSILEFHYPQLFVGGAQYDSHFASANSAVYSNLLLLNTLSPAERAWELESSLTQVFFP
jgi:hypothetical protein